MSDLVGGVENGRRPEVDLTYITRRGQWYHSSWKGTDEQSGGLAMNIGVHFFDLLLWLFGAAESSEVHLDDRDRMAGALDLEGARVRWLLSSRRDDLPEEVVIPADPGDAILIDSLILHASEPNHSELSRWAYSAFCVSCEAVYTGPDNKKPELFLVQGTRKPGRI